VPLTDIHWQANSLTQFPYKLRAVPGPFVLLFTVFHHRNPASLSNVAGLGPPIYFIYSLRSPQTPRDWPFDPLNVAVEEP